MKRNHNENLKIAYPTAKMDLTHHYITNFSLTENEAEEAAESALWLTVREANWGEPPTSGLRHKIIENHPYKEISQEINAVDDLADAEHSMVTMDYYSGAWTYIGLPDPLIMMAVKRPKILSLLINKKNRKNDVPYDYTRWHSLAYSNPNTEVNTRNMIGKTALHAAIQQNEFESTPI